MIKSKIFADEENCLVYGTFVFVNMALAKHISCFCPTENILPLSPTSDSSPPSFSTADTRWHLPREFQISSSP